jgi:two-component system, OmpR family, phosphate regulon sensor histidine kinase PhoR
VTTRKQIFLACLALSCAPIAAVALLFVIFIPFAGITDRVTAARTVAIAAAGAGLVIALGLAWVAAQIVSRRNRSMLDQVAAGALRRDSELTSDRARMEAILGGMIEGVLIVNEYGRLQLVNTAARRMLNLTGDPVGRHYLEIVRHPNIAAQLGYALNGEATAGRELMLPQAPGVTFVARSAPVAVGPTVGAVLVLHDITDLRKADQIRRDFVANVSHELRTPLTAVRGYVEALMDGTGDPVQARSFLETIARHTGRMERLVRDLLRLARLDAGQDPVEQLRCDLSSLLTGVETDLETSLESRAQTVVVDVAPDAAVVVGDPSKLHDALRNLLENATNYSPAASTITITARRSGERILLTVADEGPGIPASDLTRVFERFYRVDESRARDRRDPGGTGLGLAIVKHLIELQGGKVTAGNRPEGGAVFTVELPARS